MASYSKRLSQRDADERAKKKAAGGTFLPQPMSRRANPQTEIRKPCPHCNRGRHPLPRALRTRYGPNASDGSCGFCGGDGYLDPGDKGYRR